jgi:hypothetical protein
VARRRVDALLRVRELADLETRIAKFEEPRTDEQTEGGMSDSRWCVVARVQMLPDGHVQIIHVDETEREPIPAVTRFHGPRKAALATLAGTLAAVPMRPAGSW